ncbi:hypothetical protein HYV83_01190 [Candidatus Woesearchaeota archaeon]|nr:hypothetical protein [Candidatus Woesearchaeota archaeon]
MKTSLLFLLVTSLIFISGCAQQDRQTGEMPAIQEEMNEIPPVQEQAVNATIVKEDTTSIEASAESTQSSQRDSTSSADCQPNDHPVFTASFTDIDKLARISPIGGIMVGSQSRSYVGMKKDGNDFSTLSPVYAPVDSKLVGIVYAWRGDKAAGVAEYRLDFQVSCEVTYSFDHIPQLSDKLSKLAPEKPADNTHDNPITPVLVEVGEQVGSTRKGLDFFLFNRAKKVEHINPKRWMLDHNTVADCPYDYFTNELKQKYYSLFTSAGGFVPDVKTCRSASRDVVGTLAGAWFQGDATDRQGAHLYIADDFNTVDMVREPQESTDKDYGFRLRDANPSKNPDQVKVGESVCYSDNTRFAYFQVIDINKMKVSIASGTCPSAEPSSGYEIWER